MDTVDVIAELRRQYVAADMLVRIKGPFIADLTGINPNSGVEGLKYARDVMRAMAKWIDEVLDANGNDDGKTA